MSTTDFKRDAPTREDGLQRLREFLPRAGKDYASGRNVDAGPASDRRWVSGLSPWIRHRLVTEQEVVAEVLGRFALTTADKFVQEVCWRTYWKGWLELRPAVWAWYREDVARLVGDLDRDAGLRERYEAAVEGRTGIACQDAWAHELIETGYLHNHARMWFASIWNFTLRLPWALGADFFLRHLMDGDPASNTLSWRWVGGLQTRGKTYLARAENIARYTEGRFRPRDDELASYAEPLEEDRPMPRAGRLPMAEPLDLEARTGLLLTEEDLHAESLGIGVPLAAVAGIDATAGRSPLEVGEVARAFARGAMADALQRAGAWLGVEGEQLDEGCWGEGIEGWARRHGLQQVVTADAPVGPARERLDEAKARMASAGIRLVRVRRAWDDRLWPMATAGFFPFKEKLPRGLAELGVLA